MYNLSLTTATTVRSVSIRYPIAYTRDRPMLLAHLRYATEKVVTVSGV